MSPNQMPAAEADITADMVRGLVAEQHPDLAGLPVRPLANGWDNVIFRLGDNLLARLPRRDVAARLVTSELRWLPGLAPGLPLPVPAPVRAGAPGQGYPWCWSITPYLPGEPAAERPPADPVRAAVALGRFLGALHQPAPAQAPVNPSRGVPLASRAETFARNLAAAGRAPCRDTVLAIWDSALTAPVFDQPPVWLHGDLHPANILVSQGRLSGVIDFGDLTSGDPAADLAVAWMTLPLSAHPVFRRAYLAGRDPDAGLWARGRGWALALALVFLTYSADNPLLLTVGRRALRTLLAEHAGQGPN